jgi:DinB superfamily
MDALDFFLVRYHEFHGTFVDDLTAGLTPAEVRGRPQPGVNPIAWTIWHSARIEDVGVNGFVADRPQVLHAGGWRDRLKTGRHDVGTGMTTPEVDALCAAIDLDALRGYWDAVCRSTLAVVEGLRGQPLDDVVPAERVRRVANELGAVGGNAGWLTEFWAKGRTRAWMLAQTPLLHPYGHWFEARVARGLWGRPSP